MKQRDKANKGAEEREKKLERATATGELEQCFLPDVFAWEDFANST